MNFTGVISLLFWMIVIPFCMGLIPCSLMEEHRRTPGMVLLAGYFLMWAVFGVICIPIIVFVIPYNFSLACDIFTVTAMGLAIVGILLLYKGVRVCFGGWKRPSGISGQSVSAVIRGEGFAVCVMWAGFALLLALQLYKAVFYASFDGDDAYYVVQSLIAQENGVMYYILPYTGGTTSLDVRHALAVFPMWIAFLAVKSGIHATIVSHTIMPVLLIPMSYLVYFQIAKVLFRSEKAKREQIAMFMVGMSVFQIFGYVSLYTNETFFLTRTWQGKAVVGSLIIPALFWLLFEAFYEEKDGRSGRGFRMLLLLVNMCAGVCSSIAVFLVTILMGVVALFVAVARRNPRVILQMLCVCIPNVFYVALYLGLSVYYRP